ncbi:MAG: hypothetical protein Q9209_001665 [Squamulea sp. 1 TL-2023]
MKVILAGSTGFIGQEVLEQCLQNPIITSIVALLRRDLKLSNPKLKIAIVDNFLEYPESVSQNMEGAEACIWCLGRAWMPDNDAARKVCLEYTMAAAMELTSTCATTANSKNRKFCFVYLSGAAAERDQTKPLWFKQDYRRIRANQERFESIIFRPGLVLAKETNFRDMVRGLGPSVSVDKLAGAMINKALEGGGSQIVENSEIGI